MDRTGTGGRADISVFIGAVIGPLTFGFTSARAGFGAAGLGISLAAAVAACVMLMARRPLRGGVLAAPAEPTAGAVDEGARGGP